MFLSIPSAASANQPPQATKEAKQNATRVIHSAGVSKCKPARRGLAFYQIRHSTWLELRGVKHRPRFNFPRGCEHTLWRAKLWRSRAYDARQTYYKWSVSQQQYTLKDFIVSTGDHAWFKAIEQAQKPYPGTESWLKSCSASEGGWGRWVPNSQGSGANGWLQFMEGTFWRMFGAAKIDVESRGYKVPASAASWYSPLGQALAGAWGISNGRRHEWVGHGC